MKKITIKPAWTFTSDTGERIDPHVFKLLGAIHSHQKLTLAAKQSNLSYRHAWDLLGKWEQFFGSPLVVMERGKGTLLTPLGEKLLWAEQRSDARLFPQLENIASELNLAISNSLAQSKTIIRIHASHGFAIAKLPELMAQHQQTNIDLQYMGSIEALQSLERGNCDFAGFHIPEGDIGTQISTQYLPHLTLRHQKIVRLVTRTQGLMIAATNPCQIKSLTDLTTNSVRFVNRQHGSGTRMLFDHLLDVRGIDKTLIQGYNNCEFTHSAIAAFVASNMADVGFGVEAAAKQFNLTFVPIIREHYMLTCRKEVLKKPAMRDMLALIKSNFFHDAITQLPGYAPDQPGDIISISDMLAEIAN